jgi:hypothetical protein
MMKLEERMLRRGGLWADRQSLGRRRVSEQDRLEEPGVIFAEFVLIGRSAWIKGEFDRHEVYYVFAEVPETDLREICGVRCRKLRRGRRHPRRL